MKRILTIATLLTAGTALGQTAIPSWAINAPWTREYRALQVEELRREGRLPLWTNYICGDDRIGMNGGLIMLMAYQDGGVAVGFRSIEDERRYGYIRGLTYQEYFGTDEKVADVRTVNMPQSPEEYRQNMTAAQAAIANHTPNATISQDTLVLSNEMSVALNNASAAAKSAMHDPKVIQYGFDKDIAKDPEVKALLDEPDGTNYRNFIAQHQEYFDIWLARQKFHNAGWDPDNMSIYREGNVIYETGGTGSGTFETATGMSKSESRGLTYVRIQMIPTPSGLRYMQSYPSGVGMTINGACDPIAQDK
jgi:hypothetical protein